jgi:uncharacterized alkaline shock family protein YloU
MKRATDRQQSFQEASITENASELGTVKIHENVISSIVHQATCSLYGVLRLSGSTFVNNIADIVGSRKMHDRAISVDLGNDSVEITVKVDIEYGVHIPELAGNIQSAVMEEVQKITGITVSRVNVVVQSIESPEVEKLEKTEQ